LFWEEALQLSVKRKDWRRSLSQYIFDTGRNKDQSRHAE